MKAQTAAGIGEEASVTNTTHAGGNTVMYCIITVAILCNCATDCIILCSIIQSLILFITGLVTRLTV